ncbi:phage holin family protein [Serinibacter arcticus]|uniref:phage holin family protein n=1 Tax=Serinibacter arcticus TaxID=1655435 RepID=UPI001F22247F|nr:phage holin family protein [Serinibacter arcticus]
MTPVSPEDSLGTIVGRLTGDLSQLVRQEIALAKAEVTQDVTQAGKGAGLLAGAGVAGHFVLLFVSIAAWWGLGYVLGHAWSALVVALVWAIIAAVLYQRGRKELARTPGLPRTTETVAKIPAALKGHQETS